MSTLLLVFGILLIIFGAIIEAGSILGSIPYLNYYVDIEPKFGFPKFKPGKRQIIGFSIGILLIIAGIIIIILR